MNIYQLRDIVKQEELDYVLLMDILKDYARPREKISAWLKSGELIRVKKGLYIFGKQIALKPFSKEVLANLIYGPSAISLTSALSIYGLIPEKVSVVMSITNKRNKQFNTPIGKYIYHYLNNGRYGVGLKFFSSIDKPSFLIATPEKALSDQIYLVDNKIEINDEEDMLNYLLHDLRIEESELPKLNINHLIEINTVYKNKNIQVLINLLTKWRK